MTTTWRTDPRFDGPKFPSRRDTRARDVSYDESLCVPSRLNAACFSCLFFATVSVLPGRPPRRSRAPRRRRRARAARRTDRRTQPRLRIPDQDLLDEETRKAQPREALRETQAEIQEAPRQPAGGDHLRAAQLEGSRLLVRRVRHAHVWPCTCNESKGEVDCM